MLDDHDYTGNKDFGHRLRPSFYVTALGGQVCRTTVDLPRTEVRSELQRDEYATTSQHRGVISKRALLKDKLRRIDAEQLRQEQEIERRLEAMQRKFDEDMHRIEERRRQIEEETTSQLLKLQIRQEAAKKNLTVICKSTYIAQSTCRQSSSTHPAPQETIFALPKPIAESVSQPHQLLPTFALGTDESPSSPQLPPGTGRRERGDKFTQLDSQQQSSRTNLPQLDSQQQSSPNELPHLKCNLQDSFFVTSSHTPLTSPGRSDGEKMLLRQQNTSTNHASQLEKVHLQLSSVLHVIGTLRTSSYSSRFSDSIVPQNHSYGTQRKLPPGAESCSWTSPADTQVQFSTTTNSRMHEWTLLTAASSTTHHNVTNFLSIHPISFDDTGQHQFVTVFSYSNDRDQSKSSKQQIHTKVDLRLCWFYTWSSITRTDIANKNIREKKRFEQMIGPRIEGKQHLYAAIKNRIIAIFRDWGKNCVSRI